MTHRLTKMDYFINRDLPSLDGHEFSLSEDVNSQTLPQSSLEGSKDNDVQTYTTGVADIVIRLKAKERSNKKKNAQPAVEDRVLLEHRRHYEATKERMTGGRITKARGKTESAHRQSAEIRKALQQLELGPMWIFSDEEMKEMARGRRRAGKATVTQDDEDLAAHLEAKMSLNGRDKGTGRRKGRSLEPYLPRTIQEIIDDLNADLDITEPDW